MPFYNSKEEAEKELKELQKDETHVYSIYKLKSGKYQIVGLTRFENIREDVIWLTN